MSIERYDGEITFSCDQCGGDEYAGTTDFAEALHHAKEGGWKIIKVNDEYHHFCDEGCCDAFKAEELDGDFEKNA